MIRTWACGGIGLGAAVALAIAGAQVGKHVPSQAAPPNSYAAAVKPLVKKYCLACHSTKAKAGSLDLERYAGLADLRKDLKPWQGVIEHLEVGDMPPHDSPQPSAGEKKRILDWVHGFLEAEGRANAGDPGYVPLRRLSNTEYNCTIRDLTGVDLMPAREFPADGAAGEGFTNAAESLTDISPTLLTKYFAAAKDVADHMVLLPDGFRFAPSKTRRDWSDASTARIHGFYTKLTDPEGKLDFKPYLAATVRHRDSIASGKETIAAVAAAEKLNAKYLGILWATLTDKAPSYPLDTIRTSWQRASEKDIPALVGEIEARQAQLWRVVRVGSYTHPEGKGYGVSTSRQLAVDPVAAKVQTLHVNVKPAPGQNEVVVRLAARDMGAVGKVVWQNPRFEGDGKASLALREYAKFGREYEVDYPAAFASTSRYLAAAVESEADKSASTDSLAKKHSLDPDLLKRWIGVLALEPYSADTAVEFPGRPFAAIPLGLLGEQYRGAQKAIGGWQIPGGLPAVLANSSDTMEHIPGDAAPHSVVVHPTPTEFVAVTWTSPISGRVRVRGKIVHAHAACGNGVAWWLEQRRGDRASMFAEGQLGVGGSAAPTEKEIKVQKGDTLLLAVDAKNGDHGCDLTKISFTLTEQGGGANKWDLADDVSGDILAGNPHADRLGNKAVWTFVKGPARAVGTSALPVIPPGSALAEWKRVALDPAHRTESTSIAEKVQTVLSGGRPANDNDPNRAMYDLLLSPGGPLLQGMDVAHLPKRKSAPSFGLPPERFNSDNGIVADCGTVTEVRLPAALFVGREFVVEGKLDTPADDRAVLFQASSAPITPDIRWDGVSPVVAQPDGTGFKRFMDGSNRFRDCFPLFLCYPQVIPNDEVVSLKMFHREDEPLQRLFLTDAQKSEIDRLWLEHRFISRQPDAENKYLPLFIGFVTQDGGKEMVDFFEGQRPAFKKRADEFLKEEEAAIPAQLNGLRDFTARALRRPLEQKEVDAQLALYHGMRAKGMAHEEAVRNIIARVLVSPGFLFRIEHAPAGKLAGPVNDWQLATRLSYFLWSSAPDAELLRLARSGRLHEPAVLAAQTRRMIQDARVRSLAVEFGAQWIHVRGFDELNEKNERLFPTFNGDLRKAIYEETILFFQDLFQADRPATSILDADYTFVNETLAKHYGITGVTGPEWRRVTNVRKLGRGGLLGLASVQSKESGASRTSPVLRGNWVVETLLGEKMPRPPANVPKIPEDEGVGGLTTRQQVERHSKDPACSACHRRMDPYGFALESYDPIGRLRTKDLSGLSIDSKAILKDGSRFEGIDGLRSYLMAKKKDVILRLFCRRLLGYALGRSVANSDQPLIDNMMLQLKKNGGKVSAAVQTIVSSQQFRMIRGKEYAGIK